MIEKTIRGNPWKTPRLEAEDRDPVFLMTGTFLGYTAKMTGNNCKPHNKSQTPVAQIQLKIFFFEISLEDIYQINPIRSMRCIRKRAAGMRLMKKHL